MAADIYKEQPPSIQQIMRRTSYQVRLGKKLDNIVRKVTDNNIRLASQPVDMIRIKVNRDNSNYISYDGKNTSEKVNQGRGE